uniref:Uncharacterized protein n=1 Tax=Rhizophora mucronata TaxID=61149 RepID=A0A2P2Q7J0_RHIMU
MAGSASHLIISWSINKKLLQSQNLFLTSSTMFMSSRDAGKLKLNCTNY